MALEQDSDMQKVIAQDKIDQFAQHNADDNITEVR